ncbi:MAG: MBL fold metallo-hydrolase [Thermoplasmata archaeon]|nr:MBL fold metallo-hydrolase [Thermoplasmata archaeon]
MIRIHCLVENSVKFGTHFWGEHGLCLFVEKNGSNFFLDAGGSREVLQHNLEISGLDPGIAGAILLSHGHYDHTTGLPLLLQKMRNPALYAHPGVFAEHYAYSGEKYRYIGVQFEREEIEGLCKMKLGKKPVEISEGVYFSGEIPGVRPKKGKFFLKAGESYVDDALVDDAAVYLTTKKGTVVIFGCGHAGVINTAEHAKKLTAQKIYGIFGGTHLVSATSEELEEVVEFLKAEEVEMLRLAHCTGREAEWVLKKEFGKKFGHFPAGSVETIED